MAEQMQGSDDMEFEKLFSALDSIKASDELKNSTLDAIFSAAATDDSAAANVTELPHKPKLVKGKHSKRRNSRTLRITGIAACLAIFGIGSTIYAMPTSYASVEDGDTTLTLGINSLGMTVSATADSSRGDKLIADNDVTNKNYRDAVGTVATAIADKSDAPEKSISLSVASDDSSQRDAVKKGSSEAIEISGYKKSAPIAKEKAAEKKATAETASTSSDKAAASEQAEQANASKTAKTDDSDESVSFEINTDNGSAAKSDTDADAEDSGKQIDKYHPLTDDSKSSDDSASEDEAEDAGSDAETTVSASSESSQE